MRPGSLIGLAVTSGATFHRNSLGNNGLQISYRADALLLSDEWSSP
jgi:hypothetical protein